MGQISHPWVILATREQPGNRKGPEVVIQFSEEFKSIGTPNLSAVSLM